MNENLVAWVSLLIAIGTALGGGLVWLFNFFRQNSKDIAEHTTAEANLQDKVFKQASEMMARLESERGNVQKELDRIKTELIKVIDRHKSEKKELEERYKKEMLRIEERHKSESEELLEQVRQLEDDNKALENRNDLFLRLLEQHGIAVPE